MKSLVLARKRLISIAGRRLAADYVSWQYRWGLRESLKLLEIESIEGGATASDYTDGIFRALHLKAPAGRVKQDGKLIHKFHLWF
jgi:hypothetical protein